MGSIYLNIIQLGIGAGIVGQIRDIFEGFGLEIMLVSMLEGDKVINQVGEDLGNIEEIMIDVLSG